MENQIKQPLPIKLMPFFLFFLKKYRFWYSLDISIWFVRAFFAFFISSYPYRWITEAAENGSLNMNNGSLYSIAYAIAMASWSLAFALTRKIAPLCYSAMNRDITNEMFYYCLDHEINYFNNRLSGDIDNKITTIARRNNEMMWRIMDVFNGSIMIILSIYSIARIRIIFAAIAIVWLIIYGFILSFLFKISSKKRKLEAENKSIANGIQTDCFINISNIKIFSAQNKERRTIRLQSNKILRSSWDTIKTDYIINITNYLMRSSFYFLILFMLLEMILKKEMVLGEYLFFSSLLYIFTYWVKWMIDSSMSMLEYISITQNAMDKIIQPIEIQDKKNAEILNVNSGKIVFNNIVFAYKKDGKKEVMCNK